MGLAETASIVAAYAGLRLIVAEWLPVWRRAVVRPEGYKPVHGWLGFWVVVLSGLGGAVLLLGMYLAMWTGVKKFAIWWRRQ